MNRRRKDESGYALLLILLMGALLAISLYREIPRVAFETQRQKEQLLIERGEQYKRAIQLFYRKNARYPQKIEDLENTNNIRFLRKRYKDPMTGKDEWRVIHIAGGILTDSKLQTQKDQDQKKQGPFSTYLGEVAGLGQQLPPGANGQTAGGTANPALRRRGSEGAPGMPGGPNAPGMQPYPGGVPGVPGQPMAGVAGVPGMPGGVPGQPGIMGQPGVPGIPGQPGGQPVFPTGVPPVGVGGRITPGRGSVPGIPGSTPPGGTNPGAAAAGGSSYLGSGSSYLGGGSYLGGQPTAPINPVVTTGQFRGAAGQPGVPGMPPGSFPPGMPVNSQTGGVAPVYNTAAGSNGVAPGFSQPGVTINMNPQAQSAAAQMIGQILTQPRQGGMPMANTQGVAGGGNGIAGFASSADQDSIMVYNDQTNYGLWEFIFDPAKQKLPLNIAGGGAVGTPASQMGSQIGTPATQVGQPMGPSPFAQPAGSTPFGSGGFGPPQGGRR